jgi:hypothetical protein
MRLQYDKLLIHNTESGKCVKLRAQCPQREALCVGASYKTSQRARSGWSQHMQYSRSRRTYTLLNRLNIF